MVAQISSLALKIVVVAFVFSVLILMHEFGHFVAAKRMGVRVKRFSLGFGPEIVGITRGETKYSISIIPFGGYIKMAGEDPREGLSGKPWEYLSQPVSRRMAIACSGSISNYILSFLLFFSVLIVGSPTLTSKVGGCLPDFPAEAHGLMEGDRIVAIDGEEVKYWDQMAEIIHKRVKGDLVLEVSRDGEIFQVVITPKVDEMPDIWGKKVKVALIGITPSDEVVKLRYNPWKAFYKAGERTLTLTVITCKGIWWLISGKMPFREAVAGPIGIASIIGKVASLGIVPIFQLMAILGIALATFNLLPFPILDGGNVLFLALEKVRGRPLSPKVQENIQQVALILIIILILFVSYNDIIRMTAQ